MRDQLSRLQFLGSFGEELPPSSLPEVAFAGRSNVGKSSLLNQMLGRKRAARVSSTPGRTQHINLFQVGNAVMFADLPGYGYAKVPGRVQDAWKGYIESYLGERANLRLVVVIVDARRDPMAIDEVLIQGLQDAGIPHVVVATKMDKLKKQAGRKQVAAIRRGFHLEAGQPIAFSSVTGEGKNTLWNAIEAACRGGEHGA